MVLPHLGGWEWAGYWLTGIGGHQVTVVVEDITPAGVREFFLRLRSELGMNVVVLSSGAGPQVATALARNHIVCLVADRDIDGGGVPVEFFGEPTTVPAGPATLALRTGATLLPVAVYFEGTRHRAVVRPPLATERRGRFRDDVARISQDVTNELAGFIAAAPEQWHLLQPNWPSDHEALAQLRGPA
jgi:KDO2-lipid IV(A) lauroyltransferase